MKWYERASAVLKELHDGPVFGLVGDANMKLMTSVIADQGMSYVSARHENAAVSMAIGYAKTTGRTGVCTVTQGPGITNCLTALVAGVRGRAPIVMIAGCAPTSVPDHPQRLNQSAVFEAAGLGALDLKPDSSPEDVFAEAFARARAEMRPIAVSLPSDLQDRDVTPAPGGIPAWPAPSMPAVMPAQADIDAAAIMLAEARRPLIIAGRGAVWAGAREEIAALAERTGAVLTSTLPVYGLFADHPNHAGVVGGYATDAAAEMFHEADVIVGFGTSLGYRTTKYGRRFAPDAKVIHCDREDAALGALTPVTLALKGDAKAVARALRDALPEQASASSFAKDVVGPLAAERRRSPAPAPRGLHPVALVQKLDAVLPRERTIVVDGGHCSGFPPIYMDVPDESGFYFSLEFGSIALGIGAAIGAAVARPERLGVLMIGDGSLLMSLPDIESAARQKIPLVIVVMNDFAYGAERHLLDLHGVEHRHVSLFDNPAFDAVGKALGGRGERVADLSDLDKLPGWLDGLDGPLVLDCMVDPDIRGDWLRAALDR